MSANTTGSEAGNCTPPQTPKHSENMRPVDAAAYLTISVQRLAKMRLTGDSPPFCRVGRSIVYRKADIDSWLDANKRRSTSDAGPVAVAQNSRSITHAHARDA